MQPISFPRQVALVLVRTARDGARNAGLAFVAPTMLAAFIAAIFAAVFDSVANTADFPTDSFIEWIAPGSVLLSAFVGAGYAASALLRDIETGYLDRLRLLPIHPAALVIGRAAFEGLRIIGPAAVVLGGSLMLGADNQGGLSAFVAVVIVTAVVATAWNGVHFLVALRSQNQQAVLGLQPLFMPIIMFSTFFAPTGAAPGWFHDVASANPFTPLLAGTRGILGASVSLAELAVGLGAFLVLGTITYGLAARAFATLVAVD